MREKYIGFIFWVVVFGYFCHCSSHNEDDKSRQTFVIRYKDGEQTIPVTVVLDYKKQTEYVINMNPRTPAKSVTLYDFKQRTIAYKDLTNRECFLGRLTHETLHEEISALQDVKNPVEVKPKLRSLDPKRPALTPTEIRNIAGQKTAVFCRKMNTWLLMPERSHGINKREADDEYEERTHQYQGHRSSQYSHFERQTRRRYRNKSQANSRRRSQENKSVAEDENGKLIVPEQHFYPHQINSQSPGGYYLSSSHSHYIPDDKTQNLSSNYFIKPYSSSIRNFENDKDNENNGSSLTSSGPSSRLHSSANKFGYSNHASRLSSSNGQHYNSRPLIGTSDFFNSSETSGSTILDHGQLLDTTKDTSKDFEHKRHSAEIISGNIHLTTEKTSATDVPFSPLKHDVNSNVHPSLAHLLPLYKPLGQEFEFSKPNSQASGTSSHPSNRNSHQSNTESESHPLSSVHNEDNKFIHLTNDDNISQNPDVSINVLEVPRITKEFENVNDPASQTENVYGIHNASDNRPTYMPQTYFRNTQHFEKNNHLIHTEHLPLSLPTRVNSSRKETYLNGNSSHIPQPGTSITTLMPVLTTPQYHVTDQTTSSSLYVPSVHTAFQNSEDFISFQIFPGFIQNNVSSLERNLTIPSGQARNNNFFDDISGGITDNTFSPTEYPLTGRRHEANSHHRSDIPSVDNNYRSILYNHGVDRVRNSSPSFVNNSSNEVVPPYRTRYQNALRDFKPDEIIIDVENIPTHTFPPVTSSFQQKILTTIHPTVRSLSSEGVRNNIIRQNAQISGSTWRPAPATGYPRRINHKTRRPVQNGSVSHHQRGTLSQSNYYGKPQVQINQLIGVNQYNPVHRTYSRQFHYSNRHNIPSQVRMPTELNQLHQFSHLNNLPPGVSVHPRHPQAPFADMVHSNRPPTMPIVHDNQSSLKPHRQRHHRKKERHQNSCCRLRGKNGAFQSCCRNGGPCCSRSQRRIQSQGSSCCSQQKTYGQVIPSNQIQPPIRTTNQISPPIRNDEAHRSDSGHGDRCQKEKMCRTLYESTQQVMVCRNAHVEGC